MKDINNTHKPLEGLFSAEVGNEFITGKVSELVKLSKEYPTIKIPLSKIPDIPHHSEYKEKFNELEERVMTNEIYPLHKYVIDIIYNGNDSEIKEMIDNYLNI